MKPSFQNGWTRWMDGSLNGKFPDIRHTPVPPRSQAPALYCAVCVSGNKDTASQRLYCSAGNKTATESSKPNAEVRLRTLSKYCHEWELEIIHNYFLSDVLRIWHCNVNIVCIWHRIQQYTETALRFARILSSSSIMHIYMTYIWLSCDTDHRNQCLAYQQLKLLGSYWR